ncbi:hypothetical protein UPYG_G00194390 [Umbra pygmaea]|uniref:T-cell surface glycoprotein CD3 epsilon chain n=1 Tax=Umbra pygmaea TaxID=75934 RepID=A0ABD0WZ13_UMBPY
MNRVGIDDGRLVFLIIIMTTVTTVTTEDYIGDVSVWRDHVILSCPKTGKYYDKENKELSFGEMEGKIYIPIEHNVDLVKEYYCKYSIDDNVYQFFFKGKGCQNCFELNVNMVAMAIVGDLLLTGLVIMIVYRWAQKSSGTAAPQKPTSRSGGHAPAVPNPDYEVHPPGTRSKDIYATHRNG